LTGAVGVLSYLSEGAATFTKNRLFERPSRHYQWVIDLLAAYQELFAY